MASDDAPLIVDLDVGVLTLSNDDAVRACSTSKDQLEGMQAFLEKRRPIFTGE